LDPKTRNPVPLCVELEPFSFLFFKSKLVLICVFSSEILHKSKELYNISKEVAIFLVQIKFSQKCKKENEKGIFYYILFFFSKKFRQVFRNIFFGTFSSSGILKGKGIFCTIFLLFRHVQKRCQHFMLNPFWDAPRHVTTLGIWKKTKKLH
jgi:hypothetical protein